MASDQVDSLVTDPPAGISFMGKEWDHHKGGRKEWVAWMESVMRECLRVMKPGAHGLVWALPRTSHWTATALEDAGFEVRDVITHLFGTGFPKSLDVSKAIDKAAGAEREVLGSKGYSAPNIKGNNYNAAKGEREACMVTAPATDAAKKWQGWGTALKPASEHWILVRKPLSEKTVAANVLKWGTGAINVDASRIGHADSSDLARSQAKNPGRSDTVSSGTYGHDRPQQLVNTQNRFPANLTLDEYAAGLLDEQSGYLHASGNKSAGLGKTGSSMFGIGQGAFGQSTDYKDGGGGASRFFYVAKASHSDKNAGLEGMEPVQKKEVFGAGLNSATKLDPTMHTESGVANRPKSANTHPTVKSTTLMTYLIRMVTPPGGTVLDPFMGSGSTGVAARGLSMQFIGIEQDPDYLKISKARILKP